jgi:hypothetical protein
MSEYQNIENNEFEINEGTSIDSLNKTSYKRFREYLKGFNPNCFTMRSI